MESTFRFTQDKLEQLGCPEAKPRVLFQDKARPELYFQVTRKGAKTYYCFCWNPAKGYTDKKAIGKFEHLNLITARKRALEIAALLAQGKDLGAKQKAPTNEPTFSQAYESFISQPANREKKGPRRESTTRDYRKRYNYHLASLFGKRKLSFISFRELNAFHTKLGQQNGIYAANRTVTLIKGIFNDAILKGWEGQNPAKDIESFPERRRSRFLTEDEIGPFIKACDTEREHGSQLIADAVLLALFTGLRRTNVCSASWADIDLEHGTWNIPDTQMKNKESHLVYLSKYIQGIIAKRYKYRTCPTWVFPSVGKTGHLMEPKKGLDRIVRFAQIETNGMNMHCLKHTFLTYADDLSLPSAVRKRLAAHKGRGDVTDGYTHAREGRVREAYEKVSEHMLSFARKS